MNIHVYCLGIIFIENINKYNRKCWGYSDRKVLFSDYEASTQTPMIFERRKI